MPDRHHSYHYAGTIEFVVFVGLEGVKLVSSQVSLSFVSTYLSKFLRNGYFLVFLRLSWLHRSQISFSRFLTPWVLQGSVFYMCPHVSGTGLAVSLCVRLLWDPGSRFSTGLFYHSHSLPKDFGANVRWMITDHTFLMNKAVLILLCWGWHNRWTFQCGLLLGTNFCYSLGYCLSF